MKKKRGVDPVSMSFLDVISCGFGAVILLFMVMKHSANIDPASANPATVAETNLLEEEIRNGREGLVRVRNIISDVDEQLVKAQGLARSIQDDIKKNLDEEYFDLVDAIRENIVQYTEMDEQARLTWVRNYLETV